MCSSVFRTFVAAGFAIAVAAGCAPTPPPASRPASGPSPAPTPFLKQAGQPNVLVFVHGVIGDAFATWRNGATGAVWPEMISRDPDLADFDVYLVGYDSPLLSRSSTIEEIAQRLLRQITDDGLFDHYGQLHFVTHSMGGLVAKRMLVELNRPQPRDLERLRRVRTVVFLSTPAQGAEIAKLGGWLSQNPQFANMEPATLNAFIQSLENQWQAMLRDRDDTDAEFPKAFCAYETRPMLAGVVVVNRIYAATRCDDTPMAFDLDHSAIVKPADARSQPYPWVKAQVLRTSRMPAARAPMAREFRLTVQVHAVVGDAKGPQLEARRFTGAAATDAPDPVVEEAVQWLTTRLGQIYQLDRHEARFRLRVPADPGKEPVVLDPMGETPAEVFLYLVESGRKLRVPLDRNTLTGLNRDFDLEINVPGYMTTVRRIVWGQVLDETFTVPPAPLQVGIEDFPGDPGFAVRLAAGIAGHPRIQVKPPATLAELRRELEEERAAIARSPMVQTSLRRSLGLDVLISGRYDTP